MKKKPISTPKSKEAKLSILMLGALGVVYGDIGTSPLYALKQCFGSGALALNQHNILGVTSLIIYSLLLIVSVKYLVIIFKATNEKEGGVLSLATLCTKHLKNSQLKNIVISLGIIGGALFCGDSIITPAISVLGALEGLTLVSPTLSHFIPIISIVVLGLLFLIQKNGSGVIGKYFGLVMLLWFLMIGLLGLCQIIKSPLILKALNPYYGYLILVQQPKMLSLILGATILAITGVEALYADIGHFSIKSISYCWNFLVMPTLALNYCGQGALLLTTPAAALNPFYLLGPSWALYPMIFIAAFATIIASQSVISGVFSLTALAIKLNYLPKFQVLHTSSYIYGQVYVPVINYLLLGLTIITIIIFKNSTDLSYSYGLAATLVMFVTTILTAILAGVYWRWSNLKIILIMLPFLLLDIIFVSSNLHKLLLGAALPMLVTISVYLFVGYWRKKYSATQQ